MNLLFFFFFFQAEDGIRDKLVTGVQTCALPISTMWMYMPQLNQYSRFSAAQAQAAASGGRTDASEAAAAVSSEGGMGMFGSGNPLYGYRSLSSNVKDAEILRSEKLHVGGSDMDCWV